jgi:hypothetical protein
MEKKQVGNRPKAQVGKSNENYGAFLAEFLHELDRAIDR